MTSETVSAVGTAAAALAAVIAIFVALRSLKATQRASLVEHSLKQISECLTAIASISTIAGDLNKATDGEMRSRQALRASFDRYDLAMTQLLLMESALGLKIEESNYARWVLGAARGIAVDLLQADETADTMREEIEDPIDARQKPRWLSTAEWHLVSRSLSYMSIEWLGLDEPIKHPDGKKPLREWWSSLIVEYGSGRLNSVYNPDQTYFVQVTRLLRDFTATYLEPWAQSRIARVVK